MNSKDLFAKCKFNESQLEAMRQIYYKYFSPHMTDTYKGKAIVAIWEQNGVWNPSEGKDKNHFNNGFVSEECRLDPLWNEFSDLLPYMGQSASITKMNPGGTMLPHVDRKWRPEALYFTIEGCSSLCISEYYDLPKTQTEPSSAFFLHQSLTSVPTHLPKSPLPPKNVVFNSFSPLT